MTKPQYLFVSAFSSFYLLHYSFLFYFTTPVLFKLFTTYRSRDWNLFIFLWPFLVIKTRRIRLWCLWTDNTPWIHWSVFGLVVGSLHLTLILWAFGRTTTLISDSLSRRVGLPRNWSRRTSIATSIWCISLIILWCSKARLLTFSF